LLIHAACCLQHLGAGGKLDMTFLQAGISSGWQQELNKAKFEQQARLEEVAFKVSVAVDSSG
jgi:hypothetical protein